MVEAEKNRGLEEEAPVFKKLLGSVVLFTLAPLAIIGFFALWCMPEFIESGDRLIVRYIMPQITLTRVIIVSMVITALGIMFRECDQNKETRGQ